MGLLLSVLVACVGVVELLDFYRNVQRNFRVGAGAAKPQDLPNIHERYLGDLKGQREEIWKRIQEEKALLGAEAGSSASNEDNLGKLYKNEFRGITALPNNGTPSVSISVPEEDKGEDIELEFASSKRSKPGRSFLLTEKRSRSPSPRRCFVVTDGETRSDLPKFTVKETEGAGDNTKCYTIKGGEGENVFPLPEQFLVAQKEEEKVEPRKISLTQQFYHEEVELSPESLIEKLASSTNKRRVQEVEERSRSPSPIPRRFGEHEFRRSPSPYPSLLPVPRNSICTELEVQCEVDEDRSPTPEKHQIALESEHCFSEYWKNNKVLVVPPIRSHQRHKRKQRRQRSVSPLVQPKNLERRKSKSEADFKVFQEFQEEQDDLFSEEPHERFLNNLDGINRSRKVTRTSLAKKSKRLKRTMVDPLGALSSSESGAASPDSGMVSASPDFSDVHSETNDTTSLLAESSMSPIPSDLSNITTLSVSSLPSEFVYSESNKTATPNENDDTLVNGGTGGERKLEKSAAGSSSDPTEPFWVNR